MVLNSTFYVACYNFKSQLLIFYDLFNCLNVGACPQCLLQLSSV